VTPDTRGSASQTSDVISRFLARLTALRHHGGFTWELARIDLDHRDRLTALLVSSPTNGRAHLLGAASPVANDRVELATFSPETDPVLFRERDYPRLVASLPLELDGLPTPIAYRPLKRAVFRIDQARLRTGRGSFYLKIRRKPLAEGVRSFVRSSGLWPALVHVDDDSGVSVELWEAAPGVCFRDTLGGPETAVSCARVGAACARLASSPLGPTFELITACEWADRASALVARHDRLFPSNPLSVDEDIHRRRRILEGLEPAPVVTAHGDLHDGQIFLAPTEPRVSFIDPDSLCAAPLEWDIANLAAHFTLRAIQRNTQRAEIMVPRMERSLVGSFRASLPPGLAAQFSSDRFQSFRTICLARLTAVYGMRPMWRAVVAPLTRATRKPNPAPSFQSGLLTFLLAAILLFGGTARAASTEAARLREGLWVEVQGEHREGKRFKASEVDVKLPKGPKDVRLRGEITAIDESGGMMSILGTVLHVDGETEILGESGEPGDRSQLRTGTWITALGVTGVLGSARATSIQLAAPSVDDDDSEIEGILQELSYTPGRTTFEVNGIEIRLSSDAEVSVRSEAVGFLGPPPELMVETSRADEDWLPPGSAFLHPSLSFGGRINARFTSEEAQNLVATPDDDRMASNLHARSYVRWTPSPFVEGFAEVRWTASRAIEDELDGEALDLDDLDHTTIESGPTYLFGRFRRLPLAAQVGRIDVEETREWFYDQNLDGVRLIAVPWKLRLETGVYRTDITPGRRDDDEKYVISRVTLPYATWFRPEIHGLYRDDRREPGDHRSWIGFRAPFRPTRALNVWADYVAARGRFRAKEVRSFATDTGVMLRWRAPFRGSIYGGYAFATGDHDRGNGVDREFRDTGIADYNDGFDGLKSFQYYGELARPELSNLRVWTAGAGVYVRPWLSLDVVAHGYRQHALRDRFRSEIPIRPTGNDKELGGEVDVIVGIRGLLPLEFEINWARFNPARAYDDRDPSSLLRIEAEWRR